MFDVEEYAAVFERQVRLFGKDVDGAAIVAFLRQLLCDDGAAQHNAGLLHMNRFDELYRSTPGTKPQYDNAVASFVYGLLRTIVAPPVQVGTPAKVLHYSRTGAVIKRKNVKLRKRESK